MTKATFNKIIANFEAGIAATSQNENVSAAIKNKATNVLNQLSDIVSNYANENMVLASSKINESVSGFTDSYLTSNNLYMDKGYGYVKLSVLVINGKIKLALNAITTSSDAISEEASATRKNMIKFAKAYVALCQ